MSSFAQKYRPKTFNEIIGQEHLMGEEGILKKLIEKNSMMHSFFYGPPGCGKTTLARVIAKHLSRPFYEMNATTLKIEELRKIFKEYNNALEKPLIFIDEVHRLSKNQQEDKILSITQRSGEKTILQGSLYWLAGKACFSLHFI